ncbi:MAG: maltose alpha-D-glucosyltransferase [Candidatus Cyclobacteriaceae bacterium M3_2C_046]
MNNQLDDNLLWYKDAIIYELHIKAFKDSNSDGIGDFRGLLEKLDYLENLGVTAIWLLPFYPSPQRDDGYDISDYYSINTSYGNIRSFKKFLNEAHKRNLRVITELVINHTSDQHPWFQRARRAKKGSVHRDYYVWSDNPKQFKDARIIFKDFETSNWTWDNIAKQYYWHRFYSHQPDLNYDNPKVQQEIFKIIDYWLDMGVDGFRLDAVPYLFERENTNCENLPETHVFLKKLRAHVDSKYQGRLLLAEANMWPEEAAAYFGEGDECHMNYHFPIMPRMFMSLKMEDRYPIIDIFDQTPEIPENCQWAMFLRNHDELTLEMVTDEERDYMYKVYTKDPKAKINLGIRHRLAPLLDNNRKKIELMNYLLFSMTGTPVIYYGDEIGMGDNYYLGDRDGVRTPMQWSADRNAGFSDTNPQKLYLPVILDPEYQYEAVNVETQQNNLSSLFWWMKRVINMRKQYKAFSRGDIKFLSPSNAKVLAFLRTYEEEIILVIANLSRFSQAVELDMRDYKEYTPIEVFSHNNFPTIKDEPYLVTLGPHGYYWFLLSQPKPAMRALDLDKPQIKAKKWSEIFEPANLKIIEKLLSNYIMNCRWFGGKARPIQTINVVERINFTYQKENFSWIIFEVRYIEGLPEMYQIPLAFAIHEYEEELRNNSPKGVISAITIGADTGILFDAVYSPIFQEALFSFIIKKKKIKVNGSEQIFYATKEVEKEAKSFKDDFRSKILSAEQSNTSLIFSNKYFFKLYRKLDRTLNPDLEITRFLTEKAGFTNVPGFAGAIEHRDEKDNPMVLGMMQEMVQNQGDAWTYFLDSLNRYFERVLAYTEFKHVPDLKGDLSAPLPFNDLSEGVQSLFDVAIAERVSLLGQRTAEMHLALGSRPEEKDFEPEASSLHYQRSLFSSLQSLVRTSYQSLDSNFDKLSEDNKAEAREVLGMKNDILGKMKEIYAHKIETMKIRNHGDYHLGQVLFTGKDFMIIDFEGEPARTFSERRLKRSPLRDVAGMIRSFHYAVYSSLFHYGSLKKENFECLEKWGELWYHYMSGFFMKSYMDVINSQNLIPDNVEDLNILLKTFLLEKAVYELNYELNNRPDWVIIPIRGIKYIMQRYANEED